MAITFVAATGITAATDTIAAFADIAWTLPAGTATNDLLLAFYGGKPFGSNPAAPNAGEYVSVNTITNGSTANAAGAGSVRATIWSRTHDGSEGNPTATIAAAYDPGISAMIALRKSNPGAWITTSTTAIDATSTSTTYSATGAATLDFNPGDWIVASLVGNDDSSNFSAWAISIAGCTLSAVTQRLTGTTTTATGLDGRMNVITAQILTGKATGAPVITATTGNADSDGASIIMLVREPAIETWSSLSL